MKRIILSLCIAALALSCSNDNDTNEQTLQQETNFYALEVGNSWVYKNYKYNVNTETYEDTGVIDSVSIVGTEAILGINYFKFRRVTTGNETEITFCNSNGEHFEYLREHDGYLVDETGLVKFINSNSNPELIQSQSIGDYFLELESGEFNIATESGTFNCLNNDFYVINENDERYPGSNNYYYAKGIGLVSDTSSFLSNPIHVIERRLDSYNVQ